MAASPLETDNNDHLGCNSAYHNLVRAMVIPSHRQQVEAQRSHSPHSTP